MKPKYYEIGKRLYDLRIKKGLTQNECREPLGDATIQMISRWENGHAFPSVPYLMKICDFYNITLDYLVFGKKDEVINQICNYEDLINDILRLEETALFSIDTYSFDHSEDCLSFSSFDQNIVSFWKEYEKLKSIRCSIGDSTYKISLLNLIKAHNKNISIKQK